MTRCLCFNSEDSAILDQGNENSQAYQVLRDAILTNTREGCLVVAKDSELDTEEPLPPGFDNCYEATQQIFEGSNEPCTLPSDECSEDSATASDTGDSSTGELTTGVPTTGEATANGQPYGDPDEFISCSGSTCLVDQELLDLVEEDPDGILEELTRLSFAEQSSQIIGLIFDDVVTGSIADTLGFQDGDVVLTVGGLPCTTLEELYDVGDYAWNASSVVVEYQHGTSVQTRTFVRD